MNEKLRDVLKAAKLDYWQDRILSQLAFSEGLSALHAGSFGTLVASAETCIIASFRREGAIGREAVLQAEDILRPLSAEAKKLRILCAAHAHIDMNWMWRWDETVAVTLETFQTMLELLEEYPDFTFSQSQASVYRIVEEYDRPMLEEIRRRVKEGRWEVSASTWVENDKNMPTGESLARHILYARKYLSGLLDVDPRMLNIDFEPDTFGHSRNLPEILSKGGVRFYYHSRGNKENTLYRWMSPSGASVIAYRDPYFYGSTIDSSTALGVLEYNTQFGLNTMLRVYGVGDHGGGPTRRDIERIMDMNAWPAFPEIRFGTYQEYFTTVEEHAEKLPVVDRELNFIFDGCYTTQARVKRGNRYSEALLNEAELFSSLSSLHFGQAYAGRSFGEAWKNVLFNQFHDILPGSGVIDTREYAMGLYQAAIATANTQKTRALKTIAQNIDTSGLLPDHEDVRETSSGGAGVGFGAAEYAISQTGRGAGLKRIFHMFNPSPREREEVVPVVVWDWKGEKDRIRCSDENGVTTPHQVVGAGFSDYWGHSYLSLLVKARVPACGYSTCTVAQAPDGKSPSHFDKGYELWNGQVVQDPRGLVLENEHIRVVFDKVNASITSLLDKSSGEEMVAPGGAGGIFRLIQEDGDALGMTAWIVGKYMTVENVHRNAKVKYVPGVLRDSIQYTLEFRASRLEVSASLDRNGSFLRFDVTCDWRETGKRQESVPQLSFGLSPSFRSRSYRYDVPCGVVAREGLDMDVPANSWAASARGQAGRKDLMIVSDSKHGFRNMDGSMSLTLLRSSYEPDPCPEFGVHRFRFFIGAIDSSSGNAALIARAYDLNHPVSVLSGTSHRGTLALSRGFMSVDKGSVALSAVKMPEEVSPGRILVRFYETDGRRTEAVIRFASRPLSAFFVDMNEEKTPDSETGIRVRDTTVVMDVAPCSTVSVIVEFAGPDLSEGGH